MPGGALVIPAEPPEQVTTVVRRCVGCGRGVALEGLRQANVGRSMQLGGGACSWGSSGSLPPSSAHSTCTRLRRGRLAVV